MFWTKTIKALSQKMAFCHIWPVHPKLLAGIFLFHSTLHYYSGKCSGRSAEKRFRKHVRLQKIPSVEKFQVKQHIDHFHEYRMLQRGKVQFSKSFSPPHLRNGTDPPSWPPVRRLWPSTILSPRSSALYQSASSRCPDLHHGRRSAAGYWLLLSSVDFWIRFLVSEETMAQNLHMAS